MELKELILRWGIGPDDWKKGAWGNQLGYEIKYPASYVKRWTRTIPDPNNRFKTIRKFDEKSAFYELALNVIVAIRNMPKYKILKKIDKYFEYLPIETKQSIRAAVYQTMVHIILNKDIWQKVNATNISLPNWSASVDSTSWLLAQDMISKYAESYLANSDITDFDLVDEGDYVSYMQSANGDIKIINKVDKLSVVNYNALNVQIIYNTLRNESALRAFSDTTIAAIAQNIIAALKRQGGQ